MVGIRWKNFIYLMIPKNACTTYAALLEKHGWQREDLDPFADYSNCIFFGHIQNPHTRHTKGLEQYIGMHHLILPDSSYVNPNALLDTANEILSDPIIGKLLISGVFDQHTYTITMLLGPLIKWSVEWIPIDLLTIQDHSTLALSDGDKFTNDFFKENGLDICIEKKDHLNVGSNPNSKYFRDTINSLKVQYHYEYANFVVSLLQSDIDMYDKTVLKYKIRYNEKI